MINAMPKRKRQTSKHKAKKIRGEMSRGLSDTDSSSSSPSQEDQITRTSFFKENIDDSVLTELTHSFNSDSEDELPQPFTIMENVSNRQFKVNDIVWAKYKQLYWPAVVLHVYESKKKIKVMFVDAPEYENSICLSVVSVWPYESNQYKHFKQQSSNDSSQLDKLHSSISAVESFLRKQVLKGNKTPPIEYFQCPFIYSVTETEKADCTEASLTNNNTDEENNLLTTSWKNTDPTSEPNEAENIFCTRQSENESDSMSDDKVFARGETCKRLIELIKSAPCREYLIDILNRKIFSDRQRRFFSSVASKRNKLKFTAGFGPIDNDSQIQELGKYLTNLIKEHLPGYRYLNTPSFVFDVLAPEALIWAIGKEHNVNRKKADCLFKKGTSLIDEHGKTIK